LTWLHFIFQELHTVTVTDASILALANSCIKLRYFTISDCDITDTSISEIMAKCLQLKYFDISRCINISSNLRANISEIYCTKLTQVEGVFSNTKHGKQERWDLMSPKWRKYNFTK